MAKKESVRTQLGQFAIVPRWVLERVAAVVAASGKGADATARAVYAYAILAAKYANHEKRAWPKREALAADVGVSLPAIARALQILRDAGAIRTERRHRADGAIVGLEYVIVQLEPGDVIAHRRPRETKAADHQVSTDTKAAADHQVPTDTMAATFESPQIRPSNPHGDGLYKGRTRSIEPDTYGERARASGAQPPLLSIQVATASADDLAVLWNETTAGASLPPCLKLTDHRRRHARVRVAERPLDEWRDVIARIAASSFCRGQNDRGWIASFGWLIKTPDTAVKVLEGLYDDRPKPERPFTNAEVEEARTWLRRVGGCRHDPRCANHQECIATFIRQRRGQTGAAA